MIFQAQPSFDGVNLHCIRYPTHLTEYGTSEEPAKPPLLHVRLCFSLRADPGAETTQQRQHLRSLKQTKKMRKNVRVVREGGDGLAGDQITKTTKKITRVCMTYEVQYVAHTLYGV